MVGLLLRIINIRYFNLGPNYTFVHFNASTLLSLYLNKFTLVVQIMHFCVTIWDKFDSETSPSNWDKFSEQSGTKTLKKNIFNAC